MHERSVGYSASAERTTLHFATISLICVYNNRSDVPNEAARDLDTVQGQALHPELAAATHRIARPSAGPVNIHERVLRSMMVPGQNHRDPWFASFFKDVLADTKYVFQTTSGTPFVFTGTGTGGWESALTNTLSPGDKVVTFRYGQFSHLWVDMMQRLGLDVTVRSSSCSSCLP